MRPKLQKRSALKLAGRNETQTLKAKRIKACKSNYPIAKGYWKLSRKAEGRRSVVQDTYKHCWAIRNLDLRVYVRK